MVITVKAAQSGASANRGVYLLVRVYTNAAEAGGASGGGNDLSGGGATSGSLTPNFSGSLPVFAISGDGSGAGMGAPAVDNTYYSNNSDSSDGWSSAQGFYSGTVTEAEPITVGGNDNGFDHSNWAAYEIPASGGEITLDGSSPVLASTETDADVMTEPFSPPAGSVVVALVIAGGTGAGSGIAMALSDSADSLTWTERAISSASDNFQPCYVFTATVGGPPFPATSALFLSPVLTAAAARTAHAAARLDVAPALAAAAAHTATAHAGLAVAPSFRAAATRRSSRTAASWPFDAVTDFVLRWPG